MNTISLSRFPMFRATKTNLIEDGDNYVLFKIRLAFYSTSKHTVEAIWMRVCLLQ